MAIMLQNQQCGCILRADGAGGWERECQAVTVTATVIPYVSSVLGCTRVGKSQVLKELEEKSHR